jgi:hypothetical protein
LLRHRKIRARLLTISTLCRLRALVPPRRKKLRALALHCTATCLRFGGFWIVARFWTICSIPSQDPSPSLSTISPYHYCNCYFKPFHLSSRPLLLRRFHDLFAKYHGNLTHTFSSLRAASGRSAAALFNLCSHLFSSNTSCRIPPLCRSK